MIRMHDKMEDETIIMHTINFKRRKIDNWQSHCSQQ